MLYPRDAMDTPYQAPGNNILNECGTNPLALITSEIHFVPYLGLRYHSSFPGVSTEFYCARRRVNEERGAQIFRPGNRIRRMEFGEINLFTGSVRRTGGLSAFRHGMQITAKRHNTPRRRLPPSSIDRIRFAGQGVDTNKIFVTMLNPPQTTTPALYLQQPTRSSYLEVAINYIRVIQSAIHQSAYRSYRSNPLIWVSQSCHSPRRRVKYSILRSNTFAAV